MRSRTRVSFISRATVASLALLLLGATDAAAETKGPTHEKIVRDCQSGRGHCTFESPQVVRTYLGKFTQVSDSLYNCGTDAVKQSLTWQDSVGSTNSLGISLNASMTEIVSAGMGASYNHTWSKSHLESNLLTLNVKPGRVAWVERAQLLTDVSGVWRTNYRWWRHLGKRHWSAPDIVTGPARKGSSKHLDSVVVSRDRAMTKSEVKSCKRTGVMKRKKFDQRKKTSAPRAEVADKG